STCSACLFLRQENEASGRVLSAASSANKGNVAWGRLHMQATSCWSSKNLCRQVRFGNRQYGHKTCSICAIGRRLFRVSAVFRQIRSGKRRYEPCRRMPLGRIKDEAIA